MDDASGTNVCRALASWYRTVSIVVFITFPALERLENVAIAHPGVAEAASAVRLTFTVHGCEGDPQVLPALHSDAGSGSLHRYGFFFCASAASP